MGTLVLVRHGESRWNVCNRFTGWVDVPLSAAGIAEARRCAVHCASFDFDRAYASELERAHETMLIILSRQGRTGIVQHAEDRRYRRWIRLSNRCGGDDIPIVTDAALNERYYGRLQGMEKGAAERKYGKESVRRWRRGFELRPPGGESLKDAFRRTLPFLSREILPKVRRGETILVVGHGNTLRAVIKHLEGISDEDISRVDLPEARPLAYAYRAGAFVRIAGHYRLDRPLR